VATPRDALFVRSRARHAAPRQVPRAAGAAGLATATALAFVPGSASAEPTDRPGRPADVAQRITALDLQAEQATEDYAEAKLALEAAQRRADEMTARIAAEQARYDEVRGTLSSFVATAYRRGGRNGLVALVTDSSPQTFLDRAAALDRIARSQGDVLATAATARHRLEEAEADAARELAVQQEAAAKLEQDKQRIEATLREQRSLLSRLEAEGRARVEAARAAAAAPDRASRDRGAMPTYTGPASGRAAIAIQEAHNKLGSPYQWGAEGPDRFDCSGLTMWVWRKAGVSLPHSSRAQYAGGRKVSRAEVQPGDLIFRGNPIHHVGIYIGDGKMIAAPQTGDVVKVQPAFTSTYAGAVRPG
jgi:cell wall-associated NlpC family hydrolase